MPVHDLCEPQVINALRKAGWSVQKSLYLQGGRFKMLVDLVAQRSAIDATEQIIIVEVKCFSEASAYLDELYRAIGQYVMYRTALQLQNLQMPLYLSVPAKVYRDLFSDVIVAAVVQEVSIHLLVIDIDREEIMQWIT